MSTRSDTCQRALLGLACCLWLAGAGCAGGGGSPGLAAGPAEPPDDWGEQPVSPSAGPSIRLAGGEAPATAWTIVLATFAAEGHRDAAANTVRQLGGVFPRLAGARVHTTASGSMVVWGLYDRVDQGQAQRDLEMVKSLTVAGRPAFPRAMLSRITLRPPGGRLHPHALLRARQRHPNVDPLYTLEVAVWGDFESGRLSLEEIQRRAEEYAARLRAQGYEAYFHHDADKRLSMVTVGLFDRTAIDRRTGFYSAAVEALLEKFPAHLVNGEELLEPVDGRRPQRGTRVQPPRLVHVPEL